MAVMTGGERLQACLAGIDAQLATAGSGPEVRIGFLESKTYPDGTSVPSVAFWNEFGNGRSPPRPFFRRMIKANASAWGPAIARLLQATNFDARKVLGQMGGLIGGQLRQSIVDLVSPPLAPSTIAAKARGGAKVVHGVYGPAKPLIDTGVMLNSVNYEVST